MKLRPSFPEIPADNPFANCKLEREPFAQILTSVIDCAEGGFTLALNGSWGTGKTTFVRMFFGKCCLLFAYVFFVCHISRYCAAIK